MQQHNTFFFIIIIIIITRYHVGRDHYYCYAGDRYVIVVMWATRAHDTTGVPVRHVNYRSSFSARAAVQHPVIAFMTSTRSPGSQPDVVPLCLRRVRGPRLSFSSRGPEETSQLQITAAQPFVDCRRRRLPSTTSPTFWIRWWVPSLPLIVVNSASSTDCTENEPLYRYPTIKTTHYCHFASQRERILFGPFPCSRRYHYCLGFILFIASFKIHNFIFLLIAPPSIYFSCIVFRLLFDCMQFDTFDFKLHSYVFFTNFFLWH